MAGVVGRACGPRPAAAPGGFAVLGYAVVVLASEAELREEWAAMRNCLLEYLPACRAGSHVALSLRERDTGERVATILLTRAGGRPVVREARRRYNRPVDAQIRAAAERAAAIYASGCAVRPPRRAACVREDRHVRRARPDVVAGLQSAFDFGS